MFCSNSVSEQPQPSSESQQALIFKLVSFKLQRFNDLLQKKGCTEQEKKQRESKEQDEQSTKEQQKQETSKREARDKTIRSTNEADRAKAVKPFG